MKTIILSIIFLILISIYVPQNIYYKYYMSARIATYENNSYGNICFDNNDSLKTIYFMKPKPFGWIYTIMNNPKSIIETYRSVKEYSYIDIAFDNESQHPTVTLFLKDK